MENTLTNVRSNQRKRLSLLWREGYTKGEIVFDFTGELNGIAQATRLYNALTVYRARCKKRALEHSEDNEIISCCKLLRISETCISIQRKQISSKSIGIAIILDKVTPKAKEKISTELKTKTILNIFTDRSDKVLQNKSSSV